MAKDPVCNMEVSESSAPAHATYNGKEYYFCSTQCEQAFKANPQQFVKAA